MDDRVAAAFAATPRAGFLRRRNRHRAAHDGPLPIGLGQTNSQPRTVAAMLRLLDVREGNRVLDVGAGSGWSTALLAHLVGPGRRVVGVELEPDLAAFGAANLRRAGRPWAAIAPAEPGVLGAPSAAPFDRILVSADAASVPPSLVAQLAHGGVMVIPVAGRLTRLTAGGATADHGPYVFVPLRARPGARERHAG